MVMPRLREREATLLAAHPPPKCGSESSNETQERNGLPSRDVDGARRVRSRATNHQLPRALRASHVAYASDGRHPKRKRQACSRSAAAPGQIVRFDRTRRIIVTVAAPRMAETTAPKMNHKKPMRSQYPQSMPLSS